MLCEIGLSSGKMIDNWGVVALLLIKFDEKHGQQLCSMYPENSISTSLIDDIKMLAMPDCLQAGMLHSCHYRIRVREKVKPLSTDSFLNCYVSFQQRHDETCKRGFIQQSLVLVSCTNFSGLAYKVLSRLTEVLEDVPSFREKLQIQEQSKTASAVVVSRHTNLQEITAVIEVAYQHFLQWKPCKRGVTHQLPFYGDMIEYLVPLEVNLKQSWQEIQNPTDPVDIHAALEGIAKDSANKVAQDVPDERLAPIKLKVKKAKYPYLHCGVHQVCTNVY